MSQIDAFKAMLERGQDSEMLRFTLGNAYFAEKAYADAVEHFRAAVAQKPDYSAAWKMLGRALAANEALSEALSAFDQGMAVAESNGDKQTAKEMTVFRRRVLRDLESSDENKSSIIASKVSLGYHRNTSYLLGICLCFGGCAISNIVSHCIWIHHSDHCGISVV